MAACDGSDDHDRHHHGEHDDSAERENHRVNQEVPWPCLLDLPTEILTSIFRHLGTVDPPAPAHAISGGPPSDCLAICRTLYPLVRALRLERVRLPWDCFDAQSVLGSLLRLPAGTLDCVHELELDCDFEGVAGKLVMGVIAQFKSLRTLRLSLEADSTFECLLDLVAELPNLQTVDLLSPGIWDQSLDSWSFELQRPIEHIRLYAESLQSGTMYHFLRAARPRHMSIRIETDLQDTAAKVPWDSIESLSLEFTVETADLARAEKLRHFVIDIQIARVDLTPLLQRIRTTFEPCRLETLKIMSSRRGFGITRLEWVWPTLISLELVMPVHGGAVRPKSFKHTMSTLYSALLDMPHLTHLTLVNISFHDCDCCSDNKSVDVVLSRRDNPVAFPALTTFVGLLRARTAVLDFRLRSSVGSVEAGTGREARWTRRRAGQDFCLQGWTLQ
ncbi:hypothetical protein JCM3774_005018 [Rhodotorula dairenensis]